MSVYILNKVFHKLKLLKKITDFEDLADIYKLLNFRNKEKNPSNKRQQNRSTVMKAF